MERLTAEDRGTFLVTTRSGTEHLWTITDEGVEVERNGHRPNAFGCDVLNGRPYAATVQAWPEVGLTFMNIINGGRGDVPWTRSSTVVSIERIS